jgi:hypothetical protein
VRVTCIPAETLRSQTQIQTAHHRVFHADAVLGVVNALRCASTRPTAGPSGIDDASARHVSGNYAMVGNLSITRRRVDAGIAQAYVGVITSVPHGTASVRQHGQRSAHPASAHRARHRAHPTHRRLMHDDRKWLVGASIEQRTSVPLAAHHPQDHALRREHVHQRRYVALD